MDQRILRFDSVVVESFLQRWCILVQKGETFVPRPHGPPYSGDQVNKLWGLLVAGRKCACISVREEDWEGLRVFFGSPIMQHQRGCPKRGGGNRGRGIHDEDEELEASLRGSRGRVILPAAFGTIDAQICLL